MPPLYIVLIAIGCAAFVALAVWFVWFSNKKLTLSEYEELSDKAPEGGVKILHLSDLHGKSFGKDNAKLLEIAEKVKPDFIAFTGDIIHKYREKDIAVALAFVEKASRVAPFVYVSGNHEMRKTSFRALKVKLKAAGAVVLDNETAEQCGLSVTGLNAADCKNNKVYEIAPKTDKFKILLAHMPQFFVRYARAGYDLVLSGHAHGGQWRIPFTRVGIYAPGQGLFPKYCSGRHICGGTHMIISRGLGNSECPLRLFNRPEAVIITIKKGGA